MIYTFLDSVKQEIGKRLMSTSGCQFIAINLIQSKPEDDKKRKLKEARLRAKNARNARRKHVLKTDIPTTTQVEVTQSQHKAEIPNDASLVTVAGILRGSGDIITQAVERDTPWLYLDYGYMGKDYRICVNETAPTKLIPGPPRYEHNIKLMSWKGGHGTDILILPPSEFYSEHFGLKEFLYDVVNTVSLHTNRPIVVRPKPFKDRKAFDLESQLRKTYCVITWGSALALECLRRGIPVISLGSCPTKPLSFKYTDLETPRMEIEPDRKALYDSLTWTNYSQAELPIAFDIIKDLYKL
jgi:hypothetical protein